MSVSMCYNNLNYTKLFIIGKHSDWYNNNSKYLIIPNLFIIIFKSNGGCQDHRQYVHI